MSFLSSDFALLGWCSQCCFMGNGLRVILHRLGGLTLLECLITLAIVAILMSIGVAAYRDQLAAARARAGAQ